ncbi:MAG TPA: cytochrome c oxidase subunit 4 [Candidatus Limnocylindrales bacterium]|jgi:Cytochrome c oxidase subunit IV
MTRDPAREAPDPAREAPDAPDPTPGPKADPQLGGPDETNGRFTAETKLFARMAIFGLAVGVAYWFLTYETAGSVMLTTFGFASGIAAVAIWAGSRATRGARDRTGDAAASAVAAATVETDVVPRPGWAPLGIAVGLGGVALAGPFGPWLAIAGLFLTIRSAKTWLDATMRETDDARGFDSHHQDDPAA